MKSWQKADAPKPFLNLESDAVGVTVVLLITCIYEGQEFICMGYYLNNGYPNPKMRENPPLKPDFSQFQWNVLASNPRVTHFSINWDNWSVTVYSLEAVENQDSTLGIGLSLSCTPVKDLGLPGSIPKLLPKNSMDYI